MQRSYKSWQIDYVGIAPWLSDDERKILTRNDVVPQSLDDLLTGLTT